MTYGLVGWPVVIVHAVLTRWRLAPSLMFGAFATFAVGSYAYWYVTMATFEGNTAHASLASALSQPLGLAKFALNVLAWPPSHIFEGFVSQRPAQLLAIAITLAGCGVAVARIGMAYLTQLGYLSGRPVRRLSFHAAIMVVAALGMSVLMGLSRLGWNPSNGYNESRYGVVGSIFWCGLLVLLALELRVIWARRCVVLFGILTAIMTYVPAQRYEYMLAEREQNIYKAGVLATFRLDFGSKMPSLYWGSPEIFEVWHRSRSPDPSYAEREPFKWIGRSLLELQQTTAAIHCLGQVNTVNALEGEPRVLNLDGWAMIATKGDYLRWVLVAGDDNIGVGAGRPGLPGPDVRNPQNAAGLNDFSRQERNSGFQIAAVVDPNKSLFLWGISSEGRACRIGAIKRE